MAETWKDKLIGGEIEYNVYRNDDGSDAMEPLVYIEIDMGSTHKTIDFDRESAGRVVKSLVRAFRLTEADEIGGGTEMTEITRWAYILGDDEGEAFALDDQGAWVTYDDHAAEIERLKAENESLNDQLKASRSAFAIGRESIMAQQKLNDQKDAEIERLERQVASLATMCADKDAENERLKASLEKALRDRALESINADEWMRIAMHAVLPEKQTED